VSLLAGFGLSHERWLDRRVECKGCRGMMRPNCSTWFNDVRLGVNKPDNFDGEGGSPGPCSCGGRRDGILGESGGILVCMATVSRRVNGFRTTLTYCDANRYRQGLRQRACSGLADSAAKWMSGIVWILPFGPIHR
jgi:hypothetical protein